jgi:hypothetical protein
MVPFLYVYITNKIEEKEQIRVDSESGYCVRVGQHVYP